MVGRAHAGKWSGDPGQKFGGVAEESHAERDSPAPKDLRAESGNTKLTLTTAVLISWKQLRHAGTVILGVLVCCSSSVYPDT